MPVHPNATVACDSPVVPLKVNGIVTRFVQVRGHTGGSGPLWRGGDVQEDQCSHRCVQGSGRHCCAGERDCLRHEPASMARTAATVLLTGLPTQPVAHVAGAWDTAGTLLHPGEDA